eukprot:5465929-Pleurochrysis_carterae.AAC.1
MPTRSSTGGGTSRPNGVRRRDSATSSQSARSSTCPAATRFGTPTSTTGESRCRRSAPRALSPAPSCLPPPVFFALCFNLPRRASSELEFPT